MDVFLILQLFIIFFETSVTLQCVAPITQRSSFGSMDLDVLLGIPVLSSDFQRCRTCKVNGVGNKTARSTTPTQDSDALDDHTRIIIEGTTHLEPAGLAIVAELDVAGGLLLETDTVIKVEAALRIAVKTGCDDDLEILFAQQCGGVGGICAQGNDAAALVVEWDRSEWHVSR